MFFTGGQKSIKQFFCLQLLEKSFQSFSRRFRIISGRLSHNYEYKGMFVKTVIVSLPHHPQRSLRMYVFNCKKIFILGTLRIKALSRLRDLSSVYEVINVHENKKNNQCFFLFKTFGLEFHLGVKCNGKIKHILK